MRKMYINDQSTINLEPSVVEKVIYEIESFARYDRSGVKTINTRDYVEHELWE